MTATPWRPKTTTKRLAPGQLELIHSDTGIAIGRYGGRDGLKWAQSADGEMLAEDSQVSVQSLQGLIIGAARRKGIIE